MSETSEATFRGFDSGDIRNLPATEAVTGTGTPQLTSLPASTGQVEAMSRHGSAVVPPRGDSSSDQTSLIRNIYEELRRGLGRRCCRAEREVRSSRHSRSLSSRRRRSSSRRLSHSHALSRSSHGLRGSSRAPRHCRGTSWWSPLRSLRVGPPPRLPSVDRLRHRLPSSLRRWGPLLHLTCRAPARCRMLRLTCSYRSSRR